MVLLAVKRWEFPVVNSSKDNSSPNYYYRSLLSAQNGFYPVSLNKQIHTGIHFDSNVLKELGCKEHNAVSCIADGEVIAYRVNSHYPKVDYGDKVAFFSTGFVLVRHLLEMELVPEQKIETAQNNSSTDNNNNSQQNPSTAPSANADSTNPIPEPEAIKKGDEKEEKKPGHRLYFYSLYMHLADIAYYDNNPKELTPAFWEQDIYRVVNHNQLDYVEGVNIRKNMNNSNSNNILAILQVGTKVNLNLDLHDEQYDWYAVSSLAEGYSSIPELKLEQYKQEETTVDILGWIFIGKQVTESEFEILNLEEHKKLLSENPEKIKTLEKELNVNLAKSKGLRVWNDFTNKNDKKLYSMLPVGTQIKISGNKKPKKYVELIEVIRDGKPTLPLPTEKKKIWYDCLENITRGKKYDDVVVLDPPFPIKAGELVGHIGLYLDDKNAINKEKNNEGKLQDIEILPKDTLKNKYFKPLLHVECFTCEDLPSYITQTQTEAGKLTNPKKFFLAVSKKAELLPTPNKEDTTVGKPYKNTKIKIISKNVNINWIQIEIKSSKEETKKLWIKNDETIAKTAKPNGEIVLNENTVAWSQHPLQVSELTKSTQKVGTPLLLSLNDKEFAINNNQAIDDQDVIWYKIKALDEKNLPIIGWVSTKGNDVKKVSAWEWFDFTQITENASLLEFYQDVKLSDKRNQYDASLDKYKPTLKATLSILDKQYPSETKQCAYIKDMYFNRLSDKPILNQALGRLLVNYESEWYSEIDAEGKMPKWEALNSEMSEDVQNVLDYLQSGEETKLNAYLEKTGQSIDSPEANEWKKERNTINGFPADYQNDPEKKLDKQQLNSYGRMKSLEQKVMFWEKEKEKIKKMLWWNDVVKGLTSQKQSTSETDTTDKNGAIKNSSTLPVKNILPATLNEDAKVWFMHPIMLKMYGFLSKRLTIVIDPGHGFTKENTGASSRFYKYKSDKGTIVESDIASLPQKVIDDPSLIISNQKLDHNRTENFLVYDVSIRLKKLLENDGYNVFLTRTERLINGQDSKIKRRARIDLANNNNADYFISIHADGLTDYTKTGSHVIYPDPTISNNEAVTLSKELANDIFSYYDVVAVQSTSPKTNPTLQILKDENKTKRRVLVELGFVTSPKDAKALFFNMDTIALQLYKGLLKNINKYY